MERDLRPLVPGPIVEFFGMPGSGKSTIAHEIAGILRERGVEVSEPTRTTDRLASDGGRRLDKFRLAASEGLAQRGRALRGVRTVLASSQSRPHGYPLSLVNWFYLAGLYRQAAQRPGVTLLDQGLLQAVWSIEFGSRSPRGQSAESWAELAGELLPPGAVAVYVNVDDEILRGRLAGRTSGMSRLDAAMASSGEEFERALARGRDALDFVEQVAMHLEQAGRIRAIRADSGSGDPVSLARVLVSELPLD